MPNRPRNPGEFCWINMLTPQPDAARDFFAQLLGWTYKPQPEFGGHIIQVQGTDVGGLWDLNAPQTPPGTPPVIGVMVRVDDVDATMKRSAELGGQARQAMDVGQNGRMGMCVDPNGAMFDLWQPLREPGMIIDGLVHGAPGWFESLTTDVPRAKTFYEKLFGWTSEDMPMPGMTYTVFKLGEDMVAGMLSITAEMGDVPPHWATYFTVSNVDESVALATRLGAQVCVPINEAPGVGRFSMLASPQGVMFYVMEYDAPSNAS